MESDIEKILAEDIVDPRKSTEKALPSRPITAARVMRKYRFSAVFPFSFAVASFVLTVLLVVAGSSPGYEQDTYLVAINASNLGHDLIVLEPAATTSASLPSTPPTPPSPSDLLDPFSSATNTLDALVANGTTDALNQAIDTLISASNISAFYYLYLNQFCTGPSSNTTSVHLTTCTPYTTSNPLPPLPTTLPLNTTTISIPLLSALSSSLDALTSTLSALRTPTYAFLILSLIGTGSSIIASLPAIFFPHSRLLVYTNLSCTFLASVFAFLGAVLATALIVGVSSLTQEMGEAVGLGLRRGERALVFVWLGWMGAWVGSMYWGAVWFVEVRRWSFVRRNRGEGERGDWRGVGREVCGDVRGVKVRG